MKIVILDNLRSAHNVGSIFRTADGAGVSRIYLIGTTPCPKDRFGREQPEIAKTSLGATKSVAWEYVDPNEVDTLIDKLKSEGVRVVAIEQTKDSILLKHFKVPSNIAYIFGNEVDGVSPTLIEIADEVVEIPMLGSKESLNVAVTAGIVLFKNG